MNTMRPEELTMEEQLVASTAIAEYRRSGEYQPGGLNELAAALAKAQGQICNAVKGADNPYFKSKYADLAAVWDACRGPLSANGLSVIQNPKANGKVVTIETVLLHSSGQWFSGELTIEAKDSSPQSIGSAITYGRRYALSAFVAIAAEDDDGNAATHHGSKEAAAAVAERKIAELKPKDKPKSDVQKLIAAFSLMKQDLFAATGNNDEYYRVLGGFGYEHSNQLISQPRKEQQEIYKAMGLVLQDIKFGISEKDTQNGATPDNYDEPGSFYGQR